MLRRVKSCITKERMCARHSPFLLLKSCSLHVPSGWAGLQSVRRKGEHVQSNTGAANSSPFRISETRVHRVYRGTQSEPERPA